MDLYTTLHIDVTVTSVSQGVAQSVGNTVLHFVPLTWLMT